jgi:hypothetical protein
MASVLFLLLGMTFLFMYVTWHPMNNGLCVVPFAWNGLFVYVCDLASYE